MTDPTTLAREVLALAEKATTPVTTALEFGGVELRTDKWKVWLPTWATNLTYEQGRQRERDFEFLAHAGTYYAALARALLEAQEENERLRGLLSRAEPFVTDARALSLSYDIGIVLRPVAPSETAKGEGR